eukprot:m.162796 g.162796  ORF g.162796 m.162796 type:complete len:131 (+) comp14613_c0_seq1:236-628(+)
MALQWFKNVWNPTFDHFQSFMRNSPDGDVDDLYDDDEGGCQDFDLMVNLDANQFEELLLDPTESITTEAREYVAELLGHRASTRGGLELSDVQLQKWTRGETVAVPSQPISDQGLDLLKKSAAKILAQRS